MKVIDKTTEQLIAELEWVNTKQTHAEEELRQSEAFRFNLLENLPDVVIIANPDTSIRYANPAMEQLTGFSSDEVVGKKAPYPWWIWGKSPENADNPAKTVPDRVRTLEFYRKKSGETFWAEVTSVPVRHNGELQYYISSWIDVTEHKRAEKKVVELNIVYKRILDNAQNAILVTDNNDVFTYGNKSMGEIIGIVPETWFGKEIFLC